MNQSKRFRLVYVLILTLLVTWLLPAFSSSKLSLYSSAASVDYPAQLMNIAVKDNSKVLIENGTSDESAVSVKSLGNDLSPSWRFDRVGSDSNGTFFKLVNAQSGRLLTPLNYNVSANANVVVYGSESHKAQHWYIVPIKNDRLGNELYYKIINYSNTSLALTQSTSGITLENYTGADNQLWLLNSDGLQGFAGYCSNDNTGSIKAGNIGGLFGETVEVSNFNDLKKYATSDTPYTIVVTNNISVTELNLNGERYMCSAGRIYVHSNKTIIGSYGANTLFNVQFCTSSNNGTGNNIIIKNFEMQHDAESNNNDSIVCYFGSGENIWVDHVTFTGHNNYGYAPKTGKVDEDKFLACCYDADYCTVSDSTFGSHKYGLILGYPSDDASNKTKYDGYPRMSLISNKFDDCNTRGPGLMRWGYYHSLNNYVNKFNMAYTVISNCDIYAENCVYENGGNVICDWNESAYAGRYSELGSTFLNCNRTQQGGESNSTAGACSWRPNSNYTYVKLTATQAKTYCSSYSGCQTSNSSIMYLRFSKSGVPSAGYTELPTAPIPATFNDGSCFRIKNVNSGLYMQVEGAIAKNNANIQQWGSDGTSTHDIWKLFNAGEGYYYIASCAADSSTFVLDVAGKKNTNGTNIDLYQYNGGINQQFMLTKNNDGSYKMYTKISDGNSVIEVADASTTSGANIQQWENNGADCQNWILEAVTDPGCKMDTSFVYTFENADSGLVMDIKDGLMQDNTNVQQWGSNNQNVQKWTLKAFGSGNYYYIRSLQDSNYVLKAEGSANGNNIDIVTYSNKDSAMLFRFTKNLDGTFSIVTHASKDACLVEVADASKNNGANVQQWQPTNNNCQKWNLNTEVTTTKVTTTTTTTTKAVTTTKKTTTNKIITTPITTATIVITTEDIVTTQPPKPTAGDVNNDGQLTVTDIVLLQKWLVSIPNVRLNNWQAADLYMDGRLNILDLCIMKRLLLNN